MHTFAAIIDHSEGRESQGGFLGAHWDSASLSGIMTRGEVRDYAGLHTAANSAQAIGQQQTISAPYYRLEGQELKAGAPEIKFETGADGTAQMTVNGAVMRPEDAAERYGSAFDMDRRIEAAQIEFAQQNSQVVAAALPMPTSSPSFM